MGEVGVVVFLLGGWTLAPKKKFFFEWSFEFEVEKTKRKVHLSTSGGEHWQRRVGDGFLFSDGCLLREISNGNSERFSFEKEKKSISGAASPRAGEAPSWAGLPYWEGNGRQKNQRKKRNSFFFFFFFFGAKPNFLSFFFFCLFLCSKNTERRKEERRSREEGIFLVSWRSKRIENDRDCPTLFKIAEKLQ